MYQNFQKFMSKKKKNEDIFDLLNSATLNSHLKKYMDGLSAKVFRTFNASFTLQKELAKVKFKDNVTVEEKVLGLILPFSPPPFPFFLPPQHDLKILGFLMLIIFLSDRV